MNRHTRTAARAAIVILHAALFVAAGIAVYIGTRAHLPVVPTPLGDIPTAGIGGIGAALAVGLGLDPFVGKALTALRGPA
jgi:hypothetical protein